MTVLKGDNISLDDLFGYSKLQELLAKLITHMNGQDEAIGQLKTEIVATNKRVADQTGNIDKMGKKVDACEAKLNATIPAQEEKLRQMEAKVDGAAQLCTKVSLDLSSAVGRLNADLAAAAHRSAALETRCQGIEAEQSSAMHLIVDLQSQLTALNKVNSAVADLSTKLQKLQTSMEVAQSTLRDHEVQLGVCHEAFKPVVRDLETATADIAVVDAFSKNVAEKVTVLDNEHTVSREELQVVVQKEAADKVAIDKLEDAVRSLQANSNLRSLLDALSRKQAADMDSLRDEMQLLQNALSAQAEKGAAGTVRCFSCSSVVANSNGKFTIGTDGRTYFKCSDGNTVGLGKINLPSLQSNARNSGRGSPSRGIPARSRSASPEKVQNSMQSSNASLRRLHSSSASSLH